MAGLHILLLLYADDMVLMVRDRELILRMVDRLLEFCEYAGLTVNLTKAVGLFGGWVLKDFVYGNLFYHQSVLARVSMFKYLGLIVFGHSLSRKVAAREVIAH